MGVYDVWFYDAVGEESIFVDTGGYAITIDQFERGAPSKRYAENVLKRLGMCRSTAWVQDDGGWYAEFSPIPKMPKKPNRGVNPKFRNYKGFGSFASVQRQRGTNNIRDYLARKVKR